MLIKLSFLLAVFCSIISQIPSVLESNWGNPLKYTWIIPALLMMFKRPKEYLDKPICWFLIFILCYGSFCTLLEASSTANYIGRDFYNIIVSFLIFAVSYKFWKNYGSEKMKKWIAVFIIISGLILSFFLYVNYLKGSDIQSRAFAYNYGKNQASMIILSSLIIGMLNLFFNKKMLSVLEIGIFIFLFYIVVLLRSRSTFVGVFYLIYYFVFKSHNRKLTIFTLITTAMIIVWVLTNPNVYQIVVDGILFAGRDAQDLNELSSGRVFLLGETWEIFEQNIWIGAGNMYMDCMPVVMLAQYGIIGASMVFFFIFFIGKKTYDLDRSNTIYLTSFLLFNILVLNSLFEAQPPFGPGVKCFMLWMMLGFSFAEEIASRLRY